ncbi:MAG: UvrD-helicase domain-containing protein [Bacteroidales bacterium]|jgi:predicted small secreted protein|nr:UvrD-helicase domain-containing protein [Bacteroidales bacterium]
MIKPTAEQERIFMFTKKRPENILIKAYAGAGKCLGINTPILMYNGTIKMVQNVCVGDVLMGDDSTPRNVLSANTGLGELFKVIPVKGEEWICNDVHVLTHHHEQKKKLLDIQLNEINYPKYKNGNYRYARLQRTGVNFNKQNVNINPYLMGLWLGDGTKEDGSPTISVNVNEKPILEYLSNVKYKNIIPKFNEYQKNLMTVSLTTPNFNGRKVNNILRDEFRKSLNIDGSFSIPNNYIINSNENRMKLFAGIIDSDGYQNHKYYEISTKYESFADDILFLARSLGFSAYKSLKTKTIKSLKFSKEYWHITISGSFEEVPCLLKRKKCESRKQIKSVLRTGFKTENIGNGKYYGFTLDDNGRFLLGDFTITHNTTTIVEAVKLLPTDKQIMFLAFNKHIKEELATKLPEHVRCYTTYGLGMGAIKRKYGDKIQFDEFKADKIIQKKSKSWGLEEELKSEEEVSIYLNNMKKLCNLCRLTLTVKPEYIPYISERYDIPLSKPKDIKRVLKVLDVMTNNRKTFDYTDMIFLPVIDNSIWFFPQDYVFVDEIQDLNRCQIRIIEKVLKRNRTTKKLQGRLISVGDFFQGIYGFNAADEKSFQWFEKFPNTKVLSLSVSFRCSKAVIRKAQEIVPNIKALPNAPEGSVRDGNVLEEAQSGDFIVCRTTMPLVKLFFQFLVKQKKAIIKGSDIGVHLIELIGKINNLEKLVSFWENELKSFRKDLKKEGVLNPNEHSGYSALEDKVMTLLFLTRISDSVMDLKYKIKSIFTDEIQGIVLSTVHKIKGLEANRVFIIRPDLLPMKTAKPWQYAQEKNLEYVAYTRAKLDLIFDREWTDEN